MRKILMTLTCGRACSRSAKRTSSFCARSIAAFAAVLCCILTLHAQPISEQQAMERALQYMNSNRSSANARRMAAPALRDSKVLMPAATEATKIYAFNIDGGGFVIAEVVNDKVISYCCDNTYSFTVDNPTGIEEVKSEIGTGIVFDLQGRPLSGKPTRHGLYIQGNKKIFVR